MDPSRGKIAIICYFLALQRFSLQASITIQLSPAKYESVARDLHQLSHWFQRCHIHTILMEHQVPLYLIPSPHVLSVTEGKRSSSFLPKRPLRSLPIPMLKYMINPCQATFQLQLSKAMLGNGKEGTENFEGRLMKYRLIERYSINLLQREQLKAWEKGIMCELTSSNRAGGNLQCYMPSC